MAKIPEFSDDMEIIQKLSDYPDQDMLTTSQFKACFDKAGILIKTFLNKYVVPAINNYVASQDGLLRVEGGTMRGNIAMGGKKVTGLGTPTADSDAATKAYADEIKTIATDGKTLAMDALPRTGGTMRGDIDMNDFGIHRLPNPNSLYDAANKNYVDGKIVEKTATIPTSGWKTLSEGGMTFYYVEVDITDLSGTEYVILDYNGRGLGSDVIYRHLEWWNNVYMVLPSLGEIIVYATEVPTEEIPIKLMVVR